MSKKLVYKDVANSDFVSKVKQAALEIYLARRIDPHNEKTFLAECYVQAFFIVAKNFNINITTSDS